MNVKSIINEHFRALLSNIDNKTSEIKNIRPHIPDMVTGMRTSLDAIEKIIESGGAASMEASAVHVIMLFLNIRIVDVHTYDDTRSTGGVTTILEES